MQKWAITTNILQQSLLDERPKIVHFSGHGIEDGIFIENDVGNSILLTTNALESLFSLFKGLIDCVILNSCYSDSQASKISNYVPYVVGIQKDIPDKVSIAFSMGFYKALGSGQSYKFAYNFGINNIKLEGLPSNTLPILLET